MILVIAVALWIVWVAPYVLRNGRHQLQPAGELLADVVDIAAADPQAGKVMMMTPQQEKPMTSTQRTGPATGPTEFHGARQPAAPGPVFRIRYGRLALALAGLLSLLTGVISAALRLFGLGSAWLPAVTLLGAIGAVVLLRRLAVRDRRRKVKAAFRSAMSEPARTAPAPSAQQRAVYRESAERAESPLFDAQAVAASAEPAPKPLTALELRQAALAEAAASGDESVRAGQGPALPASAPVSWEPVEVPKPTYVEAAKAERAAPEPLDLPEAPKAVGKPSLKQGLEQAASSAALSADTDSKPVGKGQRALSNLDDVLQRRRA
ncbi:hypothetical protein ACQCSU_06360 [Pseudarthrobacter sp. O4]|uniref:hypothetical protein n=1 Tax=Pseudarthrobacter sp. O4 TaxID=3418417 RepID=UPI003CEA6F85